MRDRAGGQLVRWAPVLVALLVLIPGAVLPALRGFDGLYGQDAFAYTGYALGPLRAALLAGEPPPAFHWPPGYPLLVLATDAVTGWGDASGRLTSLLAGALVPVLVVALARELYPTRAPAASPAAAPAASVAVPVLAGVVAAVAGHLWQSSVVGMSDTAGLAAATAAAWAVCRHARSGWLPWLLLAAVLAAYAVMTR